MHTTPTPCNKSKYRFFAFDLTIAQFRKPDVMSTATYLVVNSKWLKSCLFYEDAVTMLIHRAVIQQGKI